MPTTKVVESTVTGGAELNRKLRALGPAGIQAAAGSMYRSAEKIMTDSKENYVPVDTGALRASGHVQLPEIIGDSVKVELGFGGPAGSGNHGGETNVEDVGYAIYVHEDPDAYHPVGQWKYLEVPVRNAEKAILDDLNEDLDEAMKEIAGGI